MAANMQKATITIVLCVLTLVGANGRDTDSSQPPKHLMFVSHLGRSHMIPYLEILAPLARRGHKISILTDKAAAVWLRPTYPNFDIILVPQAIEDHMHNFIHGNDSIMARMLDPRFHDATFASIMEHFTLPTYSILANHFREVFTSTKPNLLLCDWMVDACADVADTLGIKYAMTLSGIPPGVSEAPYVNGWFSPYPHSTTVNLNLWQRFYNSFVMQVKVFAAMQQPLKQLAQLKQSCGINAPEGPPGARHAHALKIINTFIGFESSRPIDPLVQLVGPIRSHVNSTVPPAIQEWLDQLAFNLHSSSSSNNGSSSASTTPRVIYVAFGTHVDLPTAVLAHLSNALLATLDVGHADGVIWAVSNIKRDKFPAAIEHDSRVLLLPFAPQKALLAHPAVSLFISHGGAESSHEAMYDGVPMLIIPFFGDQPMNAIKIREAGMGEYVRFNLVTADVIKILLSHMLSPATAAPYQAAANRMRSLVRTLDKTNTMSAANMLEFFSQYGWDHLVNAGTKMPWYKATDIDLFAAVASAVLALLSATIAAVWFMAKLVLQWLGACSRSIKPPASCTSDLVGASGATQVNGGASAADVDTVLSDQAACSLTGSSRPRKSGKGSASGSACLYDIKAKAA